MGCLEGALAQPALTNKVDICTTYMPPGPKLACKYSVCYTSILYFPTTYPALQHVPLQSFTYRHFSVKYLISHLSSRHSLGAGSPMHL